MTKAVRIGIPSLLVVLTLAWSAVILSSLTQNNSVFIFDEMNVVRIENVLKLSLKRTTHNNIIGGFYVSIRGEGISCTTIKAHDLIEKRDYRFSIRFLERFDKNCLSSLKQGSYRTDVTYAIHGKFYTRRATVKILQKDIINAGKLK